ncbi:calcitonin receptor-like [Cylas formicarius]|uniref:calcitonin receptor-like n=1 Tax=Cylas formicarius TaxID=197179 RepID=UPI002958641B|nr:calcitonin receptor-like [Cylas formicarius]
MEADPDLEEFPFKDHSSCGSNKTATPGYCPEIFDSVLCWPETPAGITANLSCPSVLGFKKSRLAFKECWDNGTWFLNSKGPWTNYTDCVDVEVLEFYQLINKLHVLGYSISLGALLISLYIFLAFRVLRCTRIKIHIQLFISFILNNIMWIVWYKHIVPEVDVTINNSIWCQIFHVLKEYIMVSNYMWMFCEALHLHLALAVVFVREERTMKWFYVIGWGVSFVIVLVHSLVRIHVTEDTGFCWMTEKPFATWFVSIPILITLLLSMVFLINILRVILTIMHPNSPNPAPVGIRRAVRAALILTPLFGLQFILIPVRPSASHPLYYVYMYATVVIIPFQGLCCAVLFCFANQDVHQAIKRSYQRNIMRQSTRWSNYQYTGGVDSGAGVFMVNGNGNTTNTTSIPLLSIRR